MISFIEKKIRYDNKVLFITLQPTLQCNFKCTYCYEKQINQRMTIETIEKIKKYINTNLKNFNELHITWFGGEPLLEKEIIKSFTTEFKMLTEKYNCKYTASISTNGYLLDYDFIEKNYINMIQITIDGDEQFHNKTRKLHNGKGTYKDIIKNLMSILQKLPDINIILRINIDNDKFKNKFSINELLESIPLKYRKNIKIDIANVFSSKNPMKLFELYKKVIDMGYCYEYFNKNISLMKNTFTACEVCIGGVVVEPNGKVSSCSMAAEKGKYYGQLTSDGNLQISNQGFYYRINNYSALSSSCKQCKYVPMCMGGCKLKTTMMKDGCIMKEDISYEEKVILDILQKEKLKVEFDKVKE